MWQKRIQLRGSNVLEEVRRQGHLFIASTYLVRWEVRSSGESDVEQKKHIRGKEEGVPSHSKNGVMNELGKCK